jgi:hypothetical protein
VIEPARASNRPGRASTRAIPTARPEVGRAVLDRRGCGAGSAGKAIRWPHSGCRRTAGAAVPPPGTRSRSTTPPRACDASAARWRATTPPMECLMTIAPGLTTFAATASARVDAGRLGVQRAVGLEPERSRPSRGASPESVQAHDAGRVLRRHGYASGCAARRRPSRRRGLQAAPVGPAERPERVIGDPCWPEDPEGRAQVRAPATGPTDSMLSRRRTAIPTVRFPHGLAVPEPVQQGRVAWKQTDDERDDAGDGESGRVHLAGAVRLWTRRARAREWPPARRARRDRRAMRHPSRSRRTASNRRPGSVGDGLARTRGRTTRPAQRLSADSAVPRHAL